MQYNQKHTDCRYIFQMHKKKDEMTPSNRRAEFINTVQQLFFTTGDESTSINDIINAVGVSKVAFYTILNPNRPFWKRWLLN